MSRYQIENIVLSELRKLQFLSLPANKARYLKLIIVKKEREPVAYY